MAPATGMAAPDDTVDVVMDLLAERGIYPPRHEVAAAIEAGEDPLSLASRLIDDHG